MTLGEIEIQELEEQPTAVIRRRLPAAEAAHIPELLQRTYEAIQSTRQEPAGMPFVRSMSMERDPLDLEVGWANVSVLPPAAAASYFGPYQEIGAADEAVLAWCAPNDHEISGAPWQSYCTDPHEEPDPTKWRTDLHFPIGE